MGCTNSKGERSEALRLCKERKKFIKQAIDSRYALAAAQLSYIQSLRNIGNALRRFAEAEILIESSMSTSATELDKTPSHSSYLSPSPSQNAEMAESPMDNEGMSSPRISTTSYMRSGGNAAMTVRMEPSFNRFVEDESLCFPPPPPPPEIGSSWDFFDPADSSHTFRFHGENGSSQDFDNLLNLKQFREEEVNPLMEEGAVKWEKIGFKENDRMFGGQINLELEGRSFESSRHKATSSKSGRRSVMANASPPFNGIAPRRLIGEEQMHVVESEVHGIDTISDGVGTLALTTFSEQCKSEKKGSEKAACAEREDPSEFITHRAKDFLSSIRDIEHRFSRAAESGKEVSRMLEANKIQIGCSETKGKSAGSFFLAACHLVCCKGDPTLLPNEPPQHVTKVITWNRSMSSQSSSSKNLLRTASRDDIDDSGSDFVEECCMISGRHSSTLDRLYAWERKLYDEVKASESIWKAYDRKCNILRHQFARDMSTQVIDKTRAIVKDLYSRVKVAIHAVDSIAKRIEKLRDDELQPQLLELVQGLIRMWKVMLECHHTQHITITLAYHAKSSTTSQSEPHRQVVIHLQHELESFGSSFVDWVNAQTCYVEALNGWLQNCILQPQERARGRRTAFSPRQARAPPIFVLCRDWSAGIKALPYKDVSEAIKGVVSNLHGSFGQHEEEQMNQPAEEQKQEESNDLDSNREREKREDAERCDRLSDLSSFQASLTGKFDRLTKFAEASLKLYEDVRQETEAARVAYRNGKMRI